MSKSRGPFVFTINNFSDDDLKAVSSVECHSINVGSEVGESGTPHLQGVIYLNSPMLIKGLNKRLGNRAWIQRCKGSWKQNVKYTSKDENIIRSEGEGPQQGQRTDLSEIKALIDSGATMQEIAEANFGSFVKNHRAFNAYRLLKRKRKRDPIDVRWYWGPSGSGKSHAAFEEFPDAYMAEIPDRKGDKLWFDGYDDESCIVFDDFRDGVIPYHKLLRLTMDIGPPSKMETKGGSVCLNNVTTIIFTSIFDPKKTLAEYDVQFERRLSTVREFRARVQSKLGATAAASTP